MNASSATRVLVSTTQRCGSTWIALIARLILGQDVAADYVGGLSFDLLEFEKFGEGDEEKVRGFSSALLETEVTTKTRIFKTHDLPPRLVPLFLDLNPNFFIVNIVRDFRDVIVSRLMYNRYFLPARGRAIESKHVADHPTLSDVELVNGFYGTSEMLEWLIHWKLFAEAAVHERSLCYGYEQMLAPEGHRRVVVDLANRLAPAGLPEERIEEIFQQSAFENVAFNRNQDRPSREDKADFCRNGVSGDYARYFSKRRSEAIKILMG